MSEISLDFFNVATLNVRGLSTRMKIDSVLECVKDLEFVSWQETYFRDNADANTFNHIFSKYFRIIHCYACADNSKTGVTMLINNKFPGSVEQHHIFNAGRALSVNYSLGNNMFTIVNVYAPAQPMEKIAIFQRFTGPLVQYSVV